MPIISQLIINIDQLNRAYILEIINPYLPEPFYTDMKIIPSRQILGVMYITSGDFWQLSPNCWDMKNNCG